MSGRSRGRPAKKRLPPPPVPETIIAGDEGEGVGSDVFVEILDPPKKKRGRPPKGGGASTSTSSPSSTKSGGGGGRDYDPSSTSGGGGSSLVANTIMRKLAKGLPPHPKDGDDVQCGDCGMLLTFWQFRLHNIQVHVNTAPTTAEKEAGDLVMDHKYFSRKLNEFKRLTKMTVFPCARKGCTSSFKSTLGLAYHMNTCGRSKEELDAVLMECEVCHMKLTLPNMQWHRKTHEVEAIEAVENPDARKTLSGSKRKSAVVARRSFKRISGAKDKSGDGDQDDDDEDNWSNSEDDEDDDDDGAGSSSASSTSSKSSKKSLRKRADKAKPIMDLESNDYTVLALEFLESLDQKGAKAWDDPPHIGEDPFLSLGISTNPLQAPLQPDMEEYLPDHKHSVEFKCTTTSTSDPQDPSSSIPSASYHRLNWFEGETVEISSEKKLAVSSRTCASIHHTGGSVLSMAWHPSGKLLAVSLAHSPSEELDSLVTQSRKSCIQIYRRSPGSCLSLQLVLGVSWGYATHLQWSTFCPDIMDSYNPGVESCFDDIEIYANIGYLAFSSEDPVVRILSLGIQDLKVAPNYEYKPPYKIKVYTKQPEIELRVDDSVVDEPLGNAVRFDWHENNKLFAVGYANGFVAVYDLQTTSSLLVQKRPLENSDGLTVVLNPFWTFQGHRLGVRGVMFDPKDSRYLVTCGQDRLMKIWDLHTKSVRDNKRTGICLDMCWVRGWMHQVASFENIVAYQSSMHNYVRVFQTGSGVGKPSSAEIFNVTSLDFYHGLTAQGTEDGKVNVTYFDWFWRECDYERNRKKKNLAVLSSVEVDRESYTPFSADDFSVEVKKLDRSVINSKTYQRLGINDEEGVYGVSLEAKFGNMNIFEPLPDLEEDGGGEEGDDDDVGDGGEEQKLFAAGILEDDDGSEEFGDLVVSDAINCAVTKAKDGLIPVYDVRNPEGIPRLNISLARKRPGTAVPVEGLEAIQVEEYIRFHTYLRINKVCWSPSGDVVAVGYRNGLITLLPGTFESIFQN